MASNDLKLQRVERGTDALASRNLKTTALMRLTMMAGAAACGADDEDAAALARYGESLGMAYQSGSDSDRNRLVFVAAVQERAGCCVERARISLNELTPQIETACVNVRFGSRTPNWFG